MAEGPLNPVPISFAKSPRKPNRYREDAKNGLDVLAVLDGLGVGYSEHAYLNWGQFEELDRIRLQDLSECFDDIWYPGSDDLDVIDAECKWILSVRHDGAVGILRL